MMRRRTMAFLGVAAAAALAAVVWLAQAAPAATAAPAVKAAPPATPATAADAVPVFGNAFDEATARQKLAQLEKIKDLLLANSNKKPDDLQGLRKWDFTDSKGKTRQAKVFVPKAYDPANARQKFPLVIVVNSWDFRVFFMPEFQEIFPCFGVMVESLSHNWVKTPWDKGNVDFQQEPTWEMQHFLDLFDYTLKEYPGIDRQRIYATGNSRDAFFCWDLAARRPDQIAAIAPLSGGGDPRLADRYIDKGIWAFIGTQDNVVPNKGSRDMIVAIKAAAKAAGKDQAYIDRMFRLSEFDAGHDVWNSVYSRPDVYLWLFSHRLEAKGQAQTPPAPKAAPSQGGGKT